MKQISLLILLLSAPSIRAFEGPVLKNVALGDDEKRYTFVACVANSVQSLLGLQSYKYMTTSTDIGGQEYPNIKYVDIVQTFEADSKFYFYSTRVTDLGTNGWQLVQDSSGAFAFYGDAVSSDAVLSSCSNGSDCSNSSPLGNLDLQNCAQ